MAHSLVRSPSALQWSDSVDTLVQRDDRGGYEYELTLPNSNSVSRQDEVLLAFKLDHETRSTSLFYGSVPLYTLSSQLDGNGPGWNTQVKDNMGKTVGVHLLPTKRTEMVVMGGKAPLKRKRWLSRNNLFSRSYAKFTHLGVVYRWHCIDTLGRISLSLRKENSAESDWIAQYKCCHKPRYNAGAGRVTIAVSLSLNPLFKEEWDMAVFSIVVLERIRGGASPTPLSYEDYNDNSNVSGWTGLYYGIP